MSSKKVFSVYDSKAQAFLPPFFAVTAGVATRQFIAAAGDASHDFSRFAEDYTLFELGDFDESDGMFHCHSAPVAVLTAITVKEMENG